MRFAFLAILLCMLVLAKEPYPQKYSSEKAGSLMIFILLNHSKIYNEIRIGDGEFLSSLIAQKPHQLNVEVLRAIYSAVNDPYQFAKIVSDI